MKATAELIRASGSHVGKTIEKDEIEEVLAQMLPEAQAQGSRPQISSVRSSSS